MGGKRRKPCLTAPSQAGFALCAGRYQIEVQPGSAWHRTHKWPMFAACPAGHTHGIQPTVTRPGPHSCP
jgi:hypothetical protein